MNLTAYDPSELFKGASTVTMRRWKKEPFVKNNTIDLSPHSFWATSTSKTKSIEVNMDDMIIIGCWGNRKNFFKFYDKNIVEFSRNDIDVTRICQK